MCYNADMKKIKIASFDGKEIAAYLWDEVTKPKGVVQLVHGMAEYCERYDHFARALNKAGYIVFADDHRGHGLTSGTELQGKTGDSLDLFNETLKDELFFSNMLIEQYNLPLFIFGHSYGSFLAQTYIQQPHPAAAVVICGSADMDGLITSAALMIARISKLFKGADAPARLIEKINFGGYQKRLKKDGEKGYWLTRDIDIAERYYADPYCGKPFSNGFYLSFFKGLKGLYKKEGLNNIKKDLPVFIIAGEKDGVGGYGKLVKKLYARYQKLGLNVGLKLYPDCRHEILNELNKEEVYDDVIGFFDQIKV